MRGCSACAQQTLRRFKGNDDELIGVFDVALKDVRQLSSGKGFRRSSDDIIDLQ
jgi:hypothetical protein